MSMKSPNKTQLCVCVCVYFSWENSCQLLCGSAGSRCQDMIKVIKLSGTQYQWLHFIKLH